MKQTICITIDSQVLKAVDTFRGDKPRSHIIEEAIISYLALAGQKTLKMNDIRVVLFPANITLHAKGYNAAVVFTKDLEAAKRIADELEEKYGLKLAMRPQNGKVALTIVDGAEVKA